MKPSHGRLFEPQQVHGTGKKLSLILTSEHDQSIREHAERDYPSECCGALVGEIIGGGKYVSLAIPLSNQHEEGTSRRFRIEADDLLLVEKLARKDKKSIIGFYHSHPDAPAVPSLYDKEHAWEVYSYLIVEVKAGAVNSARSWLLDLDADRFNEENVLVTQCILESAAGTLPGGIQE